MKILRVFLVLILLAIIILSINVNSAFVIKDTSNIINAYNNNNLIRLHVVADTNSPIDQYLKRKVRDEVHDYLAKYGQEEFTLDLLQDELLNIQNFLENLMLKEGYNNNIEVKFGTFKFPTRSYDDLRLLAGEYKALKITIGKGQGANWWCVLLPPLCIDTLENKEEKEQEELVTLNFSKREDITFRFKITELLEDSNISRLIANFFNRDNVRFTMSNIFSRRKEDID